MSSPAALRATRYMQVELGMTLHNPEAVARVIDLALEQENLAGVSMVCPLCGMAIHFAHDSRAWRQHLADCPGGDEKRSVSVSIPFEVIRPVSLDTNHVTYVNRALGLEYRFWYPEYLDRVKCAQRIAKVEPYPERLGGPAPANPPAKNELCAALMEWRALVNQKSTADFTYRAFQKLNEDYCKLVQSRWSYRIRRLVEKVWKGKADGIR